MNRHEWTGKSEVKELDMLLEELGTDQCPVAPGNRSLRCTGVALSVAAGLLGACFPSTGARMVALVGDVS
ncbi:hypothetical protein L6452_30784 [Arctium lappa]|uniref:Uncharacterized protein n=1 Tax=Arctium lappa TaxID=4217 RepID=A0ACB8ZJC1_ARCLA|nr:hypothetical protein L6452_30784 [Arctium lappa]